MSARGAFIIWALFGLGMLALVLGAVGVWLLAGWVKRLALTLRIVAGRLERIEQALAPEPWWRTFQEMARGMRGRPYLWSDTEPVAPARRPTRPVPDDPRP
jgi:hypothetical protein